MIQCIIPGSDESQENRHEKTARGRHIFLSRAQGAVVSRVVWISGSKIVHQDATMAFSDQTK